MSPEDVRWVRVLRATANWSCDVVASARTGDVLSVRFLVRAGMRGAEALWMHDLPGRAGHLRSMLSRRADRVADLLLAAGVRS